MPRKEMTPIKVADSHRKVINNYMINGFNKKRACEAAGLSPNSAADIFNRPEVKAEIERRLKLSETKTDMDREWLLGKLREIVDASPGELITVDKKGRPSLDWNKLSPELRRSIRKVVVDQSREGGKYKRTNTHVSIDPYDKLQAMKLIAQLLGLLEKKTTLQVDESVIDILQSRRTKRSEEEEDAGQE